MESLIDDIFLRYLSKFDLKSSDNTPKYNNTMGK